MQAYLQAVLAAQKDVEDALVLSAKAQTSLDAQTRAMGASTRFTQIALVRYREGEADHTSLLSAELSQSARQDALVQAQGAVTLGYIALNRALGGGWRDTGLPERLSAETEARMKARTHIDNFRDIAPAAPQH